MSEAKQRARSYYRTPREQTKKASSKKTTAKSLRVKRDSLLEKVEKILGGALPLTAAQKDELETIVNEICVITEKLAPPEWRKYFNKDEHVRPEMCITHEATYFKQLEREIDGDRKRRKVKKRRNVKQERRRKRVRNKQRKQYRKQLRASLGNMQNVLFLLERKILAEYNAAMKAENIRCFQTSSM